MDTQKMMNRSMSVEERSMHEVQTQPLTDWPNEPDVMTLNHDLLMAQPGHDANVDRVKKWIGLRDAKRAKPKDSRNKAGRLRSTVQPKLVRRQAEWRYPALSEPFLSGEDTFKVSPVTWEDMKGAQQNQLVLNYQFRTKLNPVKFIDNYVRRTVDEGTCIVKIGWVRETRKVTVMVPVWEYAVEENPEIVEQLMFYSEMMTENPQGFEELPEELQESVRYTLETGIPATAIKIGEEPEEQEKLVKNHPTLTIVDYENFYYDPSCEGDITKANFALMSFETSKAELLKDGRYKNLDKVNWSSQTPLHQPTHSTAMDNTVGFKDDLRRRVVAYEYWGFYDVNGDDTLVPIVATWIGNTMIRMEENPFPDQALPFVVVPYMPVKDSAMGEPDAELLEDNQNILGALMRGVIDLMGRSANAQTGYAKGSLDPVNLRKYQNGEDYEYNPGTDPRIAIFQHKFPEIPNSALTLLGMQNQEAEALTGVKAFSGGLSGEAYGDVATGVRGMLDAQGKREMSILRRLAQGMEEIGRKIISMNGVFLSEEEVIQVTNEEFVTVSRDDLVGEFNTKVDIATAEMDANRAADLGFMLQTLGQTLPFEITKMLLAEIARLKRMPTLARSLEKYEPQPDPVAEKMKELSVAEMEMKIAEMQAKTELHRAKAREIASNADLKDLDFIEQETGTKHVRDMAKVEAQAESNQMLEITKRVLDPSERVGKPQDVENALRLHALATSGV